MVNRLTGGQKISRNYQPYLYYIALIWKKWYHKCQQKKRNRQRWTEGFSVLTYTSNMRLMTESVRSKSKPDETNYSYSAYRILWLPDTATNCYLWMFCLIGFSDFVADLGWNCAFQYFSISKCWQACQALWQDKMMWLRGWNCAFHYFWIKQRKSMDDKFCPPQEIKSLEVFRGYRSMATKVIEVTEFKSEARCNPLRPFRGRHGLRGHQNGSLVDIYFRHF